MNLSTIILVGTTTAILVTTLASMVNNGAGFTAPCSVFGDE